MKEDKAALEAESQEGKCEGIDDDLEPFQSETPPVELEESPEQELSEWQRLCMEVRKLPADCLTPEAPLVRHVHVLTQELEVCMLGICPHLLYSSDVAEGAMYKWQVVGLCR